MSSFKISDYVDVDSLDGTELFLVSKSGVYRKTTLEEIRNLAADITNTELAELVGKAANAHDVKNILNTINTNLENQANSITQINSSLSQTMQMNYKNKIKKALITFIDDDGKLAFLTKVKNTYTQNGITCSLAINTSLIGATDMLTMSQLKTLQNEGYEILSHADSHSPLDGETEQQMIDLVVTAQNVLKTNGFKSWEHIVLPGGTTYNKNADTFDFLKRHCKSAINTFALPIDQHINKVPIDQFCINRRHVPDETLASMKAYVDEAVANNGWVIFYTHAWQDALTTTKIDELDQLIKYAKTKAISFANVDEAINLIGNIIDTDTGGTGLKISKSGVTNFAETPNQIQFGLMTGLFNKPITDYTLYSITQASVGNAQATDAPTPNIGGVLTTYRNYNQAPYCYQEWRPYNSDIIYTRRALTDTTWSAWVTHSPDKTPTASIYVNSNIGENIVTALVTAYPLNALTYEVCAVNHNANLPDLTGGILITHRLNTQHEFCYQDYMVMGTSKIYRRWGTANATWGTWILV